MARETRHPGVHAGLPSVELAFDVGPAPIGREGAARLVRERIAADGLRCERLDLSDETVRRGTLFDMSGARVLFPKGKPYDRCYVALIDPDVAARWTHPAYWAFVPADGSDIVVIQPTERPEHASGQVRLRPVPLS
jgi:hypothetical protein